MIADELYKTLKLLYDGYTAKQLEEELNRIVFLDEYNIATKAYTKREIEEAFEELIREKNAD
jgi:hypothetical protein